MSKSIGKLYAGSQFLGDVTSISFTNTISGETFSLPKLTQTALPTTAQQRGIGVAREHSKPKAQWKQERGFKGRLQQQRKAKK